MRPLPLLTATMFLAACAHVQPTDMSAEEHRAEAERHQAKAASEEDKYDPDAKAKMVVNRTPFADGELPVTASYNPTESHLESAMRHHAAARAHFDAARALETWEGAACKAIPAPARAACPLLRPAVAQVEETSRGVRLVFKDNADVEGIYNLMQCHLSFAQTRHFENAECPLYMEGVKLVRVGPKVVSVEANAAATAGNVRAQARNLFTGSDRNLVSGSDH